MDPMASVSGSLREKLSGLRHGFLAAKNTAPCIMHIDFNKELSNYDDADQNVDEENRFLSCMKEEIVSIYNSSLLLNNALEPFAPILLVLSTSEPMEHGPLASIFIHESIKIESPEDRYSMHLWEDKESYNNIKDLLRGRSAKEIIHIRDETRRRKSRSIEDVKSEGDFSYRNAINSVIEKITDGPLNFDNDGESNRHNALVPNVRWGDVGGLSHVRGEIMDAIELPLQYPHFFEQGKRSGILLFGPPGSGKTLIAKAVATECGLPFLSVKGPELLGSYVGESEENIRAIFQSAREAALGSLKKGKHGASILFFDEIDSLAPRRGDIGGGGGVMERVTATLLGELDSGGFKTNAKELKILGNKTLSIFVIAATNRPDLLDPSLLRPGRFDRLVYLGLPDGKQSRANILSAQIRKFKLERNATPLSLALEVIDSIPQNLTGADLSSVATGALMRALKRICDKADEQTSTEHKASIEKKGSSANPDSIFAGWGRDDMIPTVTAGDLIRAAKDVVPSVSEKDLAIYEDMKVRYSNLEAPKEG